MEKLKNAWTDSNSDIFHNKNANDIKDFCFQNGIDISKKEIKMYRAQRELFSSIAGLSSQHNELSLAISLASLNNAAAAWGSKHSVFNLPLPPSRQTVSAENLNLNNRKNRYLSGQSLMSLNHSLNLVEKS